MGRCSGCWRRPGQCSGSYLLATCSGPWEADACSTPRPPLRRPRQMLVQRLLYLLATFFAHYTLWEAGRDPAVRQRIESVY